MGKTHKVSLHRKKKLNVLELFFILNLILFSVISLYLGLKYPKDVEKRQILAVVMVGSVFAVFCIIVTYHVIYVVRSWRITDKIITAIHGRVARKRNKKEGGDRAVRQEELEDSIGTYRASQQPATHTELEISQQIKEPATKDGLREPLLEANHD